MKSSLYIVVADCGDRKTSAGQKPRAAGAWNLTPVLRGIQRDGDGLILMRFDPTRCPVRPADLHPKATGMRAEPKVQDRFGLVALAGRRFHLPSQRVTTERHADLGTHGAGVYRPAADRFLFFVLLGGACVSFDRQENRRRVVVS